MKNLIDKEKLKYVFLFTLIFIIIAHGYCYTNLNFSHDSLFVINDWSSASIGRYMIDIFVNIRGHYFPPLLVGALTYIFLAGTIYLLVDIFKIKKKLNIALVSGVLTTASTLTLLNATYIDFSDIYFLAIFLMTLAAYVFINKKGKISYLICILLLVLGLGTYQSYISIFIGIIILYSIKNCMENREYKDVLIDGFKAIGVLLIALILYALSLKLIVLITKIPLSTGYNGVANVGNFGNIKEILTAILKTYTSTAHYILHPNSYYKSVVSILNVIMLLINFIIGLVVIIKNKISKKNVILLLLLLLVLPFGMNIACFLSNGYVHELMIYALFILYLFPIIMIENDLFKLKIQKNVKGIYKNFVKLAYVIIIFGSIIYSNQCYLKKNLEFDNTLTTMNRVLNQIEAIDGYEIGKTKIAFVGSLNYGPLAKGREEFDYNSVGLSGNFSVTYYETYKLYFANYLSYPMNVISETDAIRLSETNEVKQMECFPHKDSVKMIDDVIVVKLSE